MVLSTPVSLPRYQFVIFILLSFAPSNSFLIHVAPQNVHQIVRSRSFILASNTRHRSDGDSNSISSFMRGVGNSSNASDTSVTVAASLTDVSTDVSSKDVLNASGSVFDRMVSYPCKFQIKVIGLSQGHFASDMLDIVSRVTGVSSESIDFKLRDTKTGKYRSITIDVPVQNAAMLYECYEALSKDPRVKFKF